MDLNVKDEIDVKQEYFDSSENYFNNEAGVDTSNKSQTIMTAGIEIFIKEEPMEHFPDEGLSFNQSQGESKRCEKLSKEEEKLMKINTLTEEGSLPINFLKVEMDPVPDEDLNFNQSEESQIFEASQVEQNIAEVHYAYFEDAEAAQYIKELTSVKEGETMNWENSIESHQDVIKKFQCHLCNYRGKRKCDLERHQNVHSDYRPFKCSHCDSAFKEKSKLKQHGAVHSDIKPFKCFHCDALFKHRRDLNRHLVIHSDLKPFACSHCEASFKTKNQLKIHIQHVHSDVRPFKCTHCDSAFKEKSKLKQHSVVHSDLRPFKCPQCESVFKHKRDLNRHSVLHSDLNPFECSLCEMAFKKKSHLRKHTAYHKNN